jgi:hypothetical protein
LHKILQRFDYVNTSGAYYCPKLGIPDRNLTAAAHLTRMECREFQVSMAAMITGIWSMRKTGQPPIHEKSRPVKGAAVTLVLAASLGGAASALAAYWLWESILIALLSYIVGGLCLVGLLLAVLCIRTRPISSMQPPSETTPQGEDSLVFGTVDTDLQDRVNVNRTTRPNTQWTQVPPGRKGRVPLVVQLGLGLSVLFALVAIDQV